MRRLYVVSLHHGTRMFSIFFFNDTATTEIYTLSLHDALPISSGAEYCIIFEQLLDSDLAFQTLCFCDPSDGYEGGFRLTDEALLQNLEREPLFQLHSRGTQNGPDRPCRSALFPDDFAEVALSNS